MWKRVGGGLGLMWGCGGGGLGLMWGCGPHTVGVSRVNVGVWGGLWLLCGFKMYSSQIIGIKSI